ncbi:MAG: protein-disulfide reductase DsbD family protein [Flavobacteriales bacterium]
MKFKFKTLKLAVFSIFILVIYFFTVSFNSAAEGDFSSEYTPQGETKPVKWTAKVEDKGCEAVLVISGAVDKGWKLYTQFPSDPLGALPTEFIYENSKDFKLGGKTTEPLIKSVFDEILGATVESFKTYPAVFKQKIIKTGKNDFTVKVRVMYMTCNDEKCIVEQDLLEIKVKGANCETNSATSENNSSVEDNFSTTEESVKQQSASTNNLAPVSIQVVTYRVSSDEYEIQFLAEIEEGWKLYTNDAAQNNFKVKEQSRIAELTGDIAVDGSAGTFAESRVVLKQKITRKDGIDSLFKATFSFTAEQNGNKYQSLPTVFTVNLNQARPIGDAAGSDKSYLFIFFIAFFSGFAALLTPCVFPMIPMTVSFFIKQSKSKAQGVKNALIYGVSIIVIYVSLGLLVSGVFGSDALNALATDIYFNLFFFFLLIIFGISFLGAFEITLPASWINKADKQADRGGLIGIFFMAFTLALVSFSCTGPIIGTLLVQAADQGGMAPFFGMLGFSAALALPFTLFAAFPGWLNSMPQSGGWLNSVKVTLGLLEIAFAFKFLSNADLVVQAHLLERETFIAIWIAVFSVLGLYLIGKIKFPHDSELKYVSVPRGLLAIFVFAFVIYMIPGMFGAPVKWIAGFPPPIHYSESPYGIGNLPPDAEGMPGGAEFGPHRLVTFHDYYDALAYSKKINKPLMLDFTGYACVNCRKMEENVWSDERVLEILKNEVVIASLHVDDKKKLPKEEQMEIDGFLIRTVGNKWSHFQKKNYQSNSQPQYILLDENEQMVTIDASYEKNGTISSFLSWLNTGLESYKERKNAPIFKPQLSLLD